MSAPQMVGEVLAIVVLGDIEQPTFSSRWLRERELIGDAEVEDTNVEILIPDEVNVFQAGWVRFILRRNALELQTQQQAESERLRDLAVGILKSSSDAKVAALGINRNVHLAMTSSAEWNAVGDSLVNNRVWDGILDLAGMRSALFWCGRPDLYAGRIQIQTQPSQVVSRGVFVAYNDHYDLTKVSSQPTTRAEAEQIARVDNLEKTTEKVNVAVEALTSNWENSMNLSKAIFERVWKLGKG